MDNRVKKSFTIEEAAEIAKIIGIDFSKEKFDLEQFRMGLDVELEHGKDPFTNVTSEDPILTGKIALAHLKEFPDYYTKLAKIEEEAKTYEQIGRMNLFIRSKEEGIPDEWVKYISPLVQCVLAEAKKGINQEHLFQEFILSGVLVGLGYMPREAIGQVETWEKTGESKLLQESKMR